ncbi:MAG: hypothetical protein ACRDT4_12915, partial [Micromonosporaceae bacterium]
ASSCGDAAAEASALAGGGAPGYGDAAGEAAALAERYPGDVGVLVSLLLNLVVLRPGEAIFMPAGNPHAYLRGMGVEVMASSDNVLRGGLTPKHVDVPELLQVLRYAELPDPRMPAVPAQPEAATDTGQPRAATDTGRPPAGQADMAAEGAVWWPVPVADFRLARALLTGGTVRLPQPGEAGPRIVLCVAGEVALHAAGDRLTLRAGEAVYVPPADGPVDASGRGELFQATTG